MSGFIRRKGAPMNMRHVVTFVRKLAAACGIGLIIATSGAPTASAAPLTLADAPLFLLQTVDPNILLTLDDSGSMTWGFLPDAVSLSDGLSDDRRGCSSMINRIYYNPSVTYDPPLDENGNELNSATPTRFTAAYTNGFSIGAGIVNLATAYQATWNPVLTTAYGPRLAGCGFSGTSTLDPSGTGANTNTRPAFYFRYNTGCGDVNNNLCYDLVQHNNAGAGGAWSADQQQNFANWYSYYRTRNLTAKTAASRAFAGLPDNVRVAGQHLNNTTSIGPKFTKTIGLMKKFSGTDRAAFFDQLFNAPASGGTPLREAAKRAGDYFTTSGTNSPWAEIPGSLKGTEHSCRQNFHILFTDGYWNGAAGVTGNVDATGLTLPDGKVYTPGGASQKIYPDANSDVLADNAFGYWKRDLRTDLTDNVPRYIINPRGKTVSNPLTDLTDAEYFNPDNDPASWQHLVTITVGLGINGTLNAANYFDRMLPDSAGDYDELLSGAKSWPGKHPSTPINDRPEAVDDLWHTAINGRGRFFSASDPASLVESFTSVLSAILARQGSAASLTSSGGVATTSTDIYQTRFHASNWTGQLLSFDIEDPDTGKIAATPNWDAGEVMNDTQAFDERAIISYIPKSDLDTREGGVAFSWDAAKGIGITQRALLVVPPTSPDPTASALLDYLRGSGANEGKGNSYRVRSCYDKMGDSKPCQPDNGKLGDIVNSAPVYVAKPPFFYPDSLELKKYADFIKANENRTAMVYAGANDGMLHGFDAISGEEKLAYVPSTTYPTLAALASPLYAHQYYVDGTPTVGDVFINGNGVGEWRTVLIGSSRKGGRGIFALDITDPSQFSEANASKLALWEFTTDDPLVPIDDGQGDADLGYTFSQPVIAKMANGKWAAVFGNGYNNVTPGSGHAALFVVFIEDGLDGTWSAGDYIKIPFKVDSDANAKITPNGFASPTLVDTNKDNQADYVYIGDLRGNLVRFDLTSVNPSNWTKPTSQRVLYTAKDANGASQPITSRPTVGRHPNGGYLVYFGTGKYLEPIDNITDPVLSPSAKTQTFYAVWDRFDNTSFARADLLQQTITTETTKNGFDVRVVSDNVVNWRPAGGGGGAGTHMGWFLDLPAQAERVVTNPMLREGRMIFTTLIPSSDPCRPSGSGWLMELDSINGGQISDTFDLTGDGLFSSADRVSGSGAAGVFSGEGAPSAPIVLVGRPDKSKSGGSRACKEFKHAGLANARQLSLAESCEPLGRVNWQQLK